MAEIVKIKKDGVIQYPITKPECVIDENGKNVLQLIKENGGGSTPDLSEYLTKEEFNKASEDFATTDALEDYATTQQLTELSAEVGKKQDTITDLETIRSGAEMGATALQSVPDTYATKTYVDEKLAQSGGQGGGEPAQYIKDASKSADGNTLTLTKKDGSVVSFSPSGSGGGMTTPSGDPMHYMYEAVGAEWNGTGADIEKQGIFGDTIIHKAGCWYLNEIGDITTEELRYMYSTRYISINVNAYNQSYFTAYPSKTIISNILASANLSLNNMCQSSKIVNALFNRNTYSISITNFTSAFIYCNNLEKILNELQFSSSVGTAFDYTYKLREVRIKGLKNDLAFKHSSNLSNASILHAINNETATTPITITLHAGAYARAMADTEITAALEAHPNVSLASA